MNYAKIALAAMLANGLVVSAQSLPGWAYGYPPSGTTPVQTPGRAGPQAAASPDQSLKRLSGSDQAFTSSQIRDGFGPADWYPGDHPAMPEIVARGRRPDIRACALCHYPNGKGRAENAPVAGYPSAYFIQQMNDFKNGVRKSTDPKKGNTNVMIAIAKAMTDEEIKASAEYFGSMKWSPWIEVRETVMVPKTRIAGGLFIALEGNAQEPIGQRIIEVPENSERSEVFRDPRSGFIAYVPIGSIKKGEALANAVRGKTVQCSVCHGSDLKGSGPVPGIAGRSPSYLVRQMYDTQQGARNGLWADLMKPVVAKLSEEDLQARSFSRIISYRASLSRGAVDRLDDGSPRRIMAKRLPICRDCLFAHYGPASSGI